MKIMQTKRQSVHRVSKPARSLRSQRPQQRMFDHGPRRKLHPPMALWSRHEDDAVCPPFFLAICCLFMVPVTHRDSAQKKKFSKSSSCIGSSICIKGSLRGRLEKKGLRHHMDLGKFFEWVFRTSLHLWDDDSCWAWTPDSAKRNMLRLHPPSTEWRHRVRQSLFEGVGCSQVFGSLIVPLLPETESVWCVQGAGVRKGSGTEEGVKGEEMVLNLRLSAGRRHYSKYS